MRVDDRTAFPDPSASPALPGPDSPLGSGGRGRFATPSGLGSANPPASPPSILRQKASGSLTPTAGTGTQAGCSPCQPGRQKTPRNRVPAQPPRLGAQVPIQTDRGRHPFMIRPLPVPIKLASKPIGHFKQRRANPLLLTGLLLLIGPFGRI